MLKKTRTAGLKIITALRKVSSVSDTMAHVRKEVSKAYLENLRRNSDYYCKYLVASTNSYPVDAKPSLYLIRHHQLWPSGKSRQRRNTPKHVKHKYCHWPLLHSTQKPGCDTKDQAPKLQLCLLLSGI